jgi:hypothetical protein
VLRSLILFAHSLQHYRTCSRLQCGPHNTADGDFYSNKASLTLNVASDCGLSGQEAGGQNLDFEVGAGFVLSTLAFVISIVQTVVYVLANRAAAKAGA